MSSDRASDRPTSLTRRRRRLAGATAAMVLLSIAGLGSAGLIKSPQQVAAEAEAPEPSVLTAPVVRGVLRQTLVLRGSVAPSRIIEVSATGPGKHVFTGRKPRVGQEVTAGHVVAEISGRPVIVLRGKFDAYRDLVPGHTGKDVIQLQRALDDLGYPTGDPTGAFGAGTQAAIKRLYAARGYDPPSRRVGTDGRDQVPSPGDDSGPTTGGRTARPESATEITLPMSEVVYAPSVPARVLGVEAAMGREIKGPVLRMSSGGLAVKAMVNPSDRDLVRPGSAVELLSEEDQRTVRGSVSRIGALAKPSGTDEAQEPGHPLTVEPDDTIPFEWAGRDIQVTVTTASTRTEVLQVPSSAIYARANGVTQVLRVSADGAQRPVEVTVGVSGDGMVEVTPKTAGLRAGDRVLVGHGK